MENNQDIKMPIIEAASDTEEEVETVEYVPVKKTLQGKTGKNTDQEHLKERSKKGNEKWREKLKSNREAEENQRRLKQQLFELEERYNAVNKINTMLAKSVKIEETKEPPKPKYMTRAELIANSKIGYSKFSKRK
jgi:siroheme synthase (precorrin-2 oxidase/ferrochelatase)